MVGWSCSPPSLNPSLHFLKARIGVIPTSATNSEIRMETNHEYHPVVRSFAPRQRDDPSNSRATNSGEPQPCASRTAVQAGIFGVCRRRQPAGSQNPLALLAHCSRCSKFFTATPNPRNPMRPSIRYHSQWLLRRSYQPNQILRFRPAARLNRVFRHVRAGPFATYECKPY